MLATEMRNPRTVKIDRVDTATMLRLINDENRNSVEAVEGAMASVAAAVDIAAAALADGGRLFYVGAGTSGRLAVQDAAECPPTYGVSPSTVVAVIAGGRRAITEAVENVEDSESDGRADILAHSPSERDVVVGISASGNAPYVLAALAAAREKGAKTVSLSSNPDAAIAVAADVAIFTDTGPEVITGSTRMKAGNAQKMILNMISTCAMIKTGKVYENLMINLRPSNAKLKRRMVGIVSEICSLSEDEALRLLEENEFSIREVFKKCGKIE